MSRTLPDRPRAVAAAMKARAQYLLCIMREMDASGVAETDAILRRAIYNVGALWAKAQGPVASPAEFREKLFSPDLREIFGLESADLSGGAVALHFASCPLVLGWRESGATEEEVARLCEIARQVDFGTIESLGMTVEMPERLGCGDARCALLVRRGA